MLLHFVGRIVRQVKVVLRCCAGAVPAAIVAAAAAPAAVREAPAAPAAAPAADTACGGSAHKHQDVIQPLSDVLPPPAVATASCWCPPFPPPAQTPFPPPTPPPSTAKTAAGGHHYTTAAHAGDKKPKNLKGSGGVKKGGAGGKFTWGNVLDEEGLSTLDRWVWDKGWDKRAWSVSGGCLTVCSGKGSMLQGWESSKSSFQVGFTNSMWRNVLQHL